MAIMNEGERLRELLDGSMDPSELENYNEFYRLAERIYGREALDEMGITTPEEIEKEKEQNGSSEFTHDVILPSPKADSPEEEINIQRRNPKRRLLLTIIGVIGLLLVSSNIAVGINSIIPVELCEDTEAPGDIGFEATQTVNGTTFTIIWSMDNLTINQNYTITWDISQNGSQELVDSGSYTWFATGNVHIHLKSVNVQTEPYAWSAELLDENLTIISTTNGDYSSSGVTTMSIIETVKKCEDNPKLKLGEITDYKNLDSWTQTGDGDMLDGMLIMTLSFISLLGLRKKKND
ncbi:MAG: hypothetical protein DBX07_00145 [Candidatus Poseidoniales archaeon]|jgi:hypothetical protein|nr:hypothetical protein [Euryarchaeota archaeon]MAV19842.1 hypothetical protein [Euryarchaeota archaeon]MDC0555875.1 hypothetical protein [Euryarchaeota archaeon]OUX45955.1 MAG: hypothetical protein CBE40_03400 [Euryarchaeota archaeon TMED280]RCH76518.1 MAG: hypothetical protein DBX07_00145 [Candidatus Poseidoniales archaeon]|tara:strand:+ start:960 stop:1838 length:879 start_codon:yes stop_codon:yes gene_type:complete